MPAKKPALPTLAAAIVDEIGDLERELAPWKPKEARLEMLRRQARACYDALGANDTAEAQGERYVLLVGVSGIQQSVNVARLARTIKLSKLVEIVSCTLTNLRLAFPGIATQFIDSEQTGPRSLKVVERGRAA